ncbi:MAG: hypothetical protein Q9196_002613 [Gyalolechia fulgens]
MRSTLHLILASAELVISSPVAPNREVRKRLPRAADNPVQGPNVAAAKVATPVETPPPLPTSSSGILLEPFKNAAIWQEALMYDEERGGIGDNRAFYRMIEDLQQKENSSHSCEIRDAGCVINPVEDAANVATALQFLQAYPARFDQSQAANPEESLVEISPVQQQTIQSFGASGAWWPYWLSDFPPAQQQNLSNLLFAEDWLHLSGYRYNLGATGDHDSVTIHNPDRGVESFMKTDGTYDWTRDASGRYYLAAAEAAGVSITFFVNAMPSALTSTLSPCGGNLALEDIPKFVSYIEAVLAHWSDSGISIEYISPMNEPHHNFADCGQEGMTVDKSIRAETLRALRAALSASTSAGAKAVKIVGDESSQVASNALKEYSSWLPFALKDKSIDAMAVHMYDWPDDATLANYAELVKNLSAPNPPPPIKMTEISTGKTASGQRSPWGWTGGKVMGPEFDPSINSALDMARQIWQWLTLVNVESWDWWTAVSNMLPCSPTTCGYGYNAGLGFNDALIYIDPQYKTTRDYEFYLPKRFWVFRHFTKFIRPGSVRYEIPNEILPYGTVAVASQGTDQVWNTIFINRNATGQDIRMKLPAAGGKIIGLTQTTETEDWANLPVPTVGADKTVLLSLPAKGVLSMQFTVSGPIAIRRYDDERLLRGDV